jgi:uncharacterized membrane protein
LFLFGAIFVDSSIQMNSKLGELVVAMLLTLVSGVFWGTWFSLSRSMHLLPADTFITIGKSIMHNVAVPMSILMPATIIGLVFLLLKTRRSQPVYFYCMLTALILFIAALVITLAVEVPIDNQIKTWTATTIPADWENIRDRWQQFHTARTFLTLGAVLFFTSALLNKRKPR